MLEDAAQAHLGHHGGTGVGHMGHAAAFSFYPGKNLGALGDGGAVISRDANVAAVVKRLRNHGCVTKYEHEVVGWCSRLDGMQAAWLQVKLAHLPAWTDARRRLATHYGARFATDGVRTVPWQDGDVHHLLVIRVAVEMRRDACATRSRRRASRQGSTIRWRCPSSRRWRRTDGRARTPSSAGRELLSLPIDPLLSHMAVDRVCDEVAALVGA